MSLTFTNGAGNRATIAAAASVNSVTKGTILIWFNFGTVTPGSQYNFWGKSAGANRFVGTIAAGAGTFQMVFAGSVQNCNATVTAANLFNIGANKECCLAFTWDFGSANNPILYTGDITHNLQAITTYSTQTPGSGLHDDSGTGLEIGGASGGSNTPTGTISRFMMWSGVTLGLNDLISQQWRPRKTSGLICHLELGFNGATGDVADWSGSGNPLTSISGTTVGAHVPLGPLFGVDGECCPYVVLAATTSPRRTLMGVGA